MCLSSRVFLVLALLTTIAFRQNRYAQPSLTRRVMWRIYFFGQLASWIYLGCHILADTGHARPLSGSIALGGGLTP